MNPFAHLKYAALSDVGKKRKNNEDAFGMFPEAGLFCVADGMGGGDDGEIASAAVVRAVEDMSVRIRPDGSGGVAAGDAGKELAEALSKVSAWIANRAREHKLNGCGSTFVGVVFDPVDPSHALAVHAGDSRLYLLHGHSIRQITRDHSVAELMGEKDESKVNPMFRSMVVNGIGIRDKAEPEFTPFKIAKGDRILLCSDGLSRMVPDKRIASVARAEKSPDKAVAALVAAALDAGGVDNVTVVLVQVGELPSPLPARKPLPNPVPPEEMETAAGDGSTESDGTGKTGDYTRETIIPGISEEQPFGAEPAELPANAAKEKNWRVFLIALAAVLVAVGCCVAMYFMLRNSGGASKPPDKPAPQQGSQPLVAPVPEANTNAANKEEMPVAPQVPEMPVPEPAPITNVAVVAADPSIAKPLEESVPPEKKEVKPEVKEAGKAPEKPAPAQVSPVLAKTSVQHEAPVCSADFIDACSEDSVRKFLKNLKRLLPGDDRNFDFAEESERFLKSAQRFVRMRGRLDAEAAAVDLRVLLLNAQPVRSAPALRKGDAGAKEILSAWDDVLKGDPADVATQTSCARLMSKIKDLKR